MSSFSRLLLTLSIASVVGFGCASVTKDPLTPAVQTRIDLLEPQLEAAPAEPNMSAAQRLARIEAQTASITRQLNLLTVTPLADAAPPEPTPLPADAMPQPASPGPVGPAAGPIAAPTMTVAEEAPVALQGGTAASTATAATAPSAVAGATASPIPGASAAGTTSPFTSNWLSYRNAKVQHSGYPSMLNYFVNSNKRKQESETNEKASHRNTAWLGKPLPTTRFIGPDGSLVDLADYEGSKQVMLVVLRGFSGQVCIGCSVQTATLAKRAQEFADRDTQIILVYPGRPDSVPAFLDAVQDVEENTVLPFPVLLDPSLTFVEKLDIGAALAKPTSILLDKDGIVRYAYVGEGYDDRPSIADLLRAVDATTPAPAGSDN